MASCSPWYYKTDDGNRLSLKLESLLQVITQQNVSGIGGNGYGMSIRRSYVPWNCSSHKGSGGAWPEGQQTEYKHRPVQRVKTDLQWRLWALCRSCLV